MFPLKFESRFESSRTRSNACLKRDYRSFILFLSFITYKQASPFWQLNFKWTEAILRYYSAHLIFRYGWKEPYGRMKRSENAISSPRREVLLEQISRSVRFKCRFYIRATEKFFIKCVCDDRSIFVCHFPLILFQNHVPWTTLGIQLTT